MENLECGDSVCDVSEMIPTEDLETDLEVPFGDVA